MVNDDPYFNPVYIIGDTPLACFLSAKLSLAGENIYRLGAGTSNPSEIYTLKDISEKNKHSVRLPAGKVMHTPARMVILCLSPEQQKSGLCTFSTAKAEQCPVLSFCRMSPKDISKILRCPVIPAYFDGWLTMPISSEIDYKGAVKGITLSLDENHPLFDDIRQILAKTYLNIHYDSDDTQNFWEYFLPETTAALFSLQTHAPFKDISKKTPLRQILNTLVDEIVSISPSATHIDKEQILREIYGIPDQWQPPLIEQIAHKQGGELSFIIQTLTKQSSYNTTTCPTIAKLLNQTLKHILSLVEE